MSFQIKALFLFFLIAGLYAFSVYESLEVIDGNKQTPIGLNVICWIWIILNLTAYIGILIWAWI